MVGRAVLCARRPQAEAEIAQDVGPAAVSHGNIVKTDDIFGSSWRRSGIGVSGHEGRNRRPRLGGCWSVRFERHDTDLSRVRHQLLRRGFGGRWRVQCRCREQENDGRTIRDRERAIYRIVGKLRTNGTASGSRYEPMKSAPPLHRRRCFLCFANHSARHAQQSELKSLQEREPGSIFFDGASGRTAAG